MTEQNANQECAEFSVSEHGRIMSGNKRFCRMFGYSEDEILWHYITDFFRHRSDFESFCNFESSSSTSFVFRMKNRKGRSFKCSISRNVEQRSDGKYLFVCKVARASEKREPLPQAVFCNESRTLLFVAKCACCNCQVRVNTLAETRMRVLCDNCASKAYPEAFNMKALQV